MESDTFPGTCRIKVFFSKRVMWPNLKGFGAICNLSEPASQHCAKLLTLLKHNGNLESTHLKKKLRTS